MVEGGRARRQPKASCSLALVNERKKAAPEGAAKFREETPRKGCGAPRRRYRAATIWQGLCCDARRSWQKNRTILKVFTKLNQQLDEILRVLPPLCAVRCEIHKTIIAAQQSRRFAGASKGQPASD
jgi:hypothetical protein